jgi:hypothetical protein
MTWVFLSDRHNPDGTVPFAPRAAARLLLSWDAMNLANDAGALVPLNNDGGYSGTAEMVGAAADLAANAHKVLERAVVHHLAATDGDWAAAAEQLKITTDEARTRFGQAWEKFEDTQQREPQGPVDPGLRRRCRSTSILEDWCAHYLDNIRGESVEGELVWPHEAGEAVITELEVRAARETAAKQAALEQKLAGYRAEYRAHLEAAVAKLAKRRGVVYTPLVPGTTSTRVVVRDGQYLGTVSKERLAAGTRWRIDGPAVTAEQRDEHRDTLAAAVDFLDRITPRTAAAL